MDTKTTWIVAVIIFFATEADAHVEVKEGPQDRAVLFGQNAELACHIHHARSKPDHIVQWVANSKRTGSGKPVSYNKIITAKDMVKKFSISTAMPYNLLIQKCDIDDAGKYTCNNVRNGKPIGELEPQLIVLEPESCPMLGISTFKENDIITFTWSVKYAGNKDDSQKPTIEWKLNGIQQDAIADETTEGVFKSTITMAAASVDDQKELTCFFSVLNIQEFCSTRLDIQYKAQKPTLFINREEITQNHEVPEGIDVNFKAVSRGNPAPSYTWQFKATGEVNFSYGEHEKGDTKQIKSIRSSDAGVYRCCARNRLNSHRRCSEITIAVRGFDQVAQPHVRSKAERTSSMAAIIYISAFIQIWNWFLKDGTPCVTFLRNLI